MLGVAFMGYENWLFRSSETWYDAEFFNTFLFYICRNTIYNSMKFHKYHHISRGHQGMIICACKIRFCYVALKKAESFIITWLNREQSSYGSENCRQQSTDWNLVVIVTLSRFVKLWSLFFFFFFYLNQDLYECYPGDLKFSYSLLGCFIWTSYKKNSF